MDSPITGSVDNPSPPDSIILSHQRSGTHLLQSLLASHPTVHGRGEIILHYRRSRKTGPSYRVPEGWVFQNRPGSFNLAIVMYSQLDTFEVLCGPVETFPVIHLLRDPYEVARSVLQMEADRARLGAHYRAHYRRGEAVPEPAPELFQELDSRATCIDLQQRAHESRLQKHSQILTVTYEELTGNRDTEVLASHTATRLLEFLRLPSATLSTPLRKTQGANAAALPAYE